MTDRSTIIPGPDNDTITAEAASWIAQIDSETMTDADRLVLREWAARSPRHLSELRRLGDMWCDIDAVLEGALPDAGRDGSVLGVLAAGARVRPVPVYGALAAGIALIIATVAAVPMLNLPEVNEPYIVAFQVDEGQNDAFDLRDGSSVHLNTDSLIEVEFDEQARKVRLIRGEVHFDIARDADRPFLVYAGGSVVRAVGTAFSVRVGEKDTSVIVTEGVVAFSALTDLVEASAVETNAVLDANDTVLRAGQSAQLRQEAGAPELTVKSISADVISNRLAWREGLLVFDGEPLTYVIDEISRYTPMRVVISDPEIRDLPIGGVFNAGEVTALLGALEASFGIEVDRVDENLIYLSRKPAP